MTTANPDNDSDNRGLSGRKGAIIRATWGEREDAGRRWPADAARHMDREETGRFTLGDLLRRHRERRGLTQEDLAACTDPQLSTDAISKIESGRRRPRRGTLLSLFVALELDTNERAAALRAWRPAPAPGHDRGEGGTMRQRRSRAPQPPRMASRPGTPPSSGGWRSERASRPLCKTPPVAS